MLPRRPSNSKGILSCSLQAAKDAGIIGMLIYQIMLTKETIKADQCDLGWDTAGFYSNV